jgi:hypothetical protein
MPSVIVMNVGPAPRPGRIVPHVGQCGVGCKLRKSGSRRLAEANPPDDRRSRRAD